MTMSNCSAPPRASTSSTARAPAMPLPTTTSFIFGICQLLEHTLSTPQSNFMQPDVHHQVPSGSRRSGQQEFELRLGRKVFNDDKRHVLARFGADREVAHDLAVAQQHEIDQFSARIAGA